MVEAGKKKALSLSAFLPGDRQDKTKEGAVLCLVRLVSCLVFSSFPPCGKIARRKDGNVLSPSCPWVRSHELFLAARLGQPHGPGVLFSLVEEDEDSSTGSPPRLVLRRDYGNESRNELDSLESQFVQFWSLEVRPTADYVFSGYHAGGGQQVLGDNFRQRCDILTTRRDEANKVAIVEFVNFHSIHFHRSDGHLRSCERFDSEFDQQPIPADLVRTREFDAMKRAYAAALTSASVAHGHPMRVEYRSIFECQLFHRKNIGPYPNVRSLLRARHPERSVLGIGRLGSITQEALVRRILERPDNSSGENDWGGFVVVAGGSETIDADFDPEMMGFCMQRSPIRRTDITPYTEAQATRYFEGHGDLADSYLDKQVGRLQTVTRRSFPPEEGEVISLEYLRWLIRRRGLKGFRIKHFLFYRHKFFLRPFVDDFLERRHRCKLDPLSSPLESALLKLILNGKILRSSPYLSLR